MPEFMDAVIDRISVLAAQRVVENLGVYVDAAEEHTIRLAAARRRQEIALSIDRIANELGSEAIHRVYERLAEHKTDDG